MEWVDGNIGSKVTMKYPSIYLVGEHAKGETLSVAFAGPGQHQDAGAKMIHMAPYTQSSIVSKSIARGGGRAGYRGEVRIAAGAHHSANTVRCDALLVDTIVALRHLPGDRHPRRRSPARPRGDRLAGQRGAAVLPDVPRNARGRGHGHDRARLHRADRPRTAHGIRTRTQQAHRNGHGRICRLDVCSALIQIDLRQKGTIRPAAGLFARSARSNTARADGDSSPSRAEPDGSGPSTSTTSSRSPAAGHRVEVHAAREGAPAGRRHARRQQYECDLDRHPPARTIEWVDRDRRRGSASPGSRRSAPPPTPGASFEKALIVTVSGEDAGGGHHHPQRDREQPRAPRTRWSSGRRSTATGWSSCRTAVRRTLTENVEIRDRGGREPHRRHRAGMGQRRDPPRQPLRRDRPRAPSSGTSPSRSAASSCASTPPPTWRTTAGEVELYGVYFADPGQHLEQQVFVNHDAPHTKSASATRARCRAQARARCGSATC